MSGSFTRNNPRIKTELIAVPLNANFTYVSPAGVSREILALRFHFATSGVAGNRLIQVASLRNVVGADKIYLTAQTLVQTASLTLQYYFSLLPLNTAGATPNILQPLPAGLILTPGDILQSYITPFDAADQLTELVVTYEERKY